MCKRWVEHLVARFLFPSKHDQLIPQQLKHKIERDERSFTFNPAVDDVSCIASMLKVRATCMVMLGLS